MWIVTLTKPPVDGHWKPEYFPHEFRYMTDALACVRAVRRAGGEAVAEPKTKRKPL